MSETILENNNIIEAMAKTCKKFLRQYNEGAVEIKSNGRKVFYQKNKDDKWVMIEPVTLEPQREKN